MTIELPLASRRVRGTTARVALVAISIATLLLLAFVALSFAGPPGHRLDGPELAPFRWAPLGNVG